MMPYPWSTRTRDVTLRLVALPSVTHTAAEREFPHHLAAWLATHPYFAAHPDHLLVAPIEDDPAGRANLYALVRGARPTTVLLTGHYDVVSVGNYSELAPWAYDPEALLPRLIAALESGGQGEADARALADLRSGDFLPGRGVLDMKSGLAAGLAALLRLADEAEQAEGSLLFIATPDEEVASHGMRGATQQLGVRLAAWGLDAVAAINLDATDARDAATGQAVFLGSVGKALAGVYVVGRDTHAGSPFDGVNAAFLAAAITRRIECSPDLADAGEGEMAPPPVCLSQADLKSHYDVTTPTSAWCAYNVLTHTWTAAEALARVRDVVADALSEALDTLQQRARLYGLVSGQTVALPVSHARVLTYAELVAEARRRSGAAVDETIMAGSTELAKVPTLDTPRFSRSIIEAVWQHSGLQGPAAVVGLASLYYPPVHLDDNHPRQARLRQAVQRQTAGLAEAGVDVRTRGFFPGISDMSFLGCAEGAATLDVMAANTPAWGTRLQYDYGVARALDIPVINVGPWGRDYHQRLERVYAPYAFGVVPEVIWRIAQDLFANQT